MRWGSPWGQIKIERGFQHLTFWGDMSEYRPPRVTVVMKHGLITPCNTCARITTCPMYQSFTRHRMRDSVRLGGTNILHLCDIYKPEC